jgi:hypothetical protein
MKTNRKCLKLLRDAFTRDGRVMCSGVDTDQGRYLDWIRLESAGLVKRKTPSMRGGLGHEYSFDITASGVIAAEAT